VTWCVRAANTRALKSSPRCIESCQKFIIHSLLYVLSLCIIRPFVHAMPDDIQLRFRSTNGDIGPFLFPDSTLVHNLRERLLVEWPKEGPLAQDPPAYATQIRLILSGKLVEPNKCLKDYRKDMGELKPDSIVTMHVVVRPVEQGQNGKQQGSNAEQKDQPKGCGCVIS